MKDKKPNAPSTSVLGIFGSRNTQDTVVFERYMTEDFEKFFKVTDSVGIAANLNEQNIVRTDPSRSLKHAWQILENFKELTLQEKNAQEVKQKGPR